MGVNTKIWGPSAWILFHGLAQFVDTLPKKHRARELLRLWFMLLSQVLPCVFCRRSYQQFLVTLPVQPPFQKWIYQVHEKVNQKLFWQQVVSLSPFAFFQYWTGYQPRTYKQVPWYPLEDPQVIHHFFHFLYCVLSDYEPARQPYLEQFFTLTQTLCHVCGLSYAESWTEPVSRIPWTSWTGRLQWLHRAQLRVENTQVPTWDQVRNHCRGYTVGCHS